MLYVGYWIPLTDDIRPDPCVDRVADTEQGHDDVPDVGSELSSVDASGRLLGLGEKASVESLSAKHSQSCIRQRIAGCRQLLVLQSSIRPRRSRWIHPYKISDDLVPNDIPVDLVHLLVGDTMVVELCLFINVDTVCLPGDRLEEGGAATVEVSALKHLDPTNCSPSRRT